jgi:adenylate cyclase
MVITAGQGTRQLVALNADVVGYSRLLADDFEATTSTMEDLDSLVRRNLDESNGTLVNFVGDNFMAVFEDAIEAIRVAIAITADIEARNDSIPESKRLRFRMGIDQGEVAVSGDQWFGDALNIAARIQAIAPPGGISVSGRIYRELDEPALRFRAVGAKDLKNIPEKIDVYEYSDLPSEGAPARLSHTLALEEPSVAVLPLHPGIEDEALKSAGDLVRADLIHRLAQVPQLVAIDAAHDSAGSARYMIELGIHRAGDRIRVYARVIDMSRISGVKAHKWTVGSDELHEMSEQMADEVARSIEVDLIVGAPASLYADIDDPEAIEKIYMGWYHLSGGTPEGWAEALDLFGQVSVSHPDQPYGHVLTAFANFVGVDQGWTPAEALDQAIEQARTGMSKGDPTGVATAIEAAIHMSQGDVDGALEDLEEVRITRPTCDITYGLEGSVRRYLGEWEKAVELVDTAMRLTGVNKPWYPTIQACSLLLGGRVERAAEIAEGVLEHQPNNLEALLVLAAAQHEMGLERRARATADLVKVRFPAVDVAGWIDRKPYQVEEMVDRWKTDLTAVGLIDRSDA